MTKEEQIAKFKAQRSNKFTLVLNDSGANVLKNSRYIYNKIMTDSKDIVFIALIYHDQDLDELINQLKTPHYHIVIQFASNYRIGSIINWLVDLFHLNENQITIEKCTAIDSQCRYLTHMDDLDKFPYDKTDIITNDLEVLKRYQSVQYVRDLGDLIRLVKEYNYNLELIMTKIKNYDKYRKYILDLINNYYRRR